MSNYYVRRLAVGDGDGIDWYNAYTDLQSALDLIPTGSGLSCDIYIDVDDYTIEAMPTIDNDITRILGGYDIDPTLVYSGYTVRPTPSFDTRITIDPGLASVIITSGVLETRNLDIYNDINEPALFDVANDGTLYVNKSTLHSNVGVYNSGYFEFDGVDIYGSGTPFIQSYAPMVISNSNVITTSTAIDVYDLNFTINNSVFNQGVSAISIKGTSISGYFEINNSLIYGGTYGLDGTGLMYGNIYKSTIEGTGNGLYFHTTPSGTVTVDTSIITSTSSGSGVYAESPMIVNVTRSNLYPGPGDVTTSECVYTAPNLSSEGYYLQLGTSDITTYSPGIDLGAKQYDYESYSEASVMGFAFPGREVVGYESFIYQKTANVVFSDLMREVRMAKWMSAYSQPMEYTYNFKKTVKEYDLLVRSAFSLVGDDGDWGHEWDYKTINSPKVGSTNYIVPRSLIDLTEIINDSFGNDEYNVNLNNIKVNSFKHLDKRGISFDYGNSSRTRLAIWMLDNDHVLTLRDVYGADNLFEYPLLLPPHPSGEKLFIRPSGLIPHGRTANGYAFIIESDVNKVIEGVDEFGNFEWLPTHLNKNYDLRGILAYKNDIFITAIYTTDEEAQPMLIRYPNKGYHEDYHTSNPYKMYLNPDNSNPTDLTVYEDGSFFVNDYNVDSSGMLIYKYKPRYDYALRETVNNDNVRLLLREHYEDVSITPSGFIA